MDWPEPPQWLVVIASIVIAPFLAIFMLLWALHDLVTGLIDLVRGPNR